MINKLIDVCRTINKLDVEIEACKEILRESQEKKEKVLRLQTILMSKLSRKKATVVRRFDDIELFNDVEPDKLFTALKNAKKQTESAYITLEISDDLIDFLTEIANKVKDPTLDKLLEEMEQRSSITVNDCRMMYLAGYDVQVNDGRYLKLDRREEGK